MVEEVIIVCDLSGSMLECGKRFILRTALQTVQQYFMMQNPNVNLRLVRWSCDFSECEWPRTAYPEELMRCEGKASVQALVDKLPEWECVPKIILTDGCWQDDARCFDAWTQSTARNDLRLVLLGADSRIPSKTIETYSSESILSALEGLGD